MWQEYSKHGELYPDEMRFQNEMFQGHRKLNLHQLTRSFCSSCFEWCQSFYLRRWNGSGPPSYMIKQPLCLIWGMKKAMRYKTGRAAPPGCAVEKNTDEKHFQFIWGPTTDFYVTTFFQPKRKVQKVTLLLGSAILQYFSIKVTVHPNHHLLTLMLFQTRINFFCGTQKYIFRRTEDPNNETQWGPKPHWIAQINSKTFFKISFTFHRRKSYRIGTTWGWILCATYPYWSDQDTKLMSINH